MESRARLTSKGQLTVPKSVRDALQLREGDQVVFRVEGERAGGGYGFVPGGGARRTRNVRR